jgi:hypothetical protein
MESSAGLTEVDPTAVRLVRLSPLRCAGTAWAEPTGGRFEDTRVTTRPAPLGSAMPSRM